ncbi:MAG: cobalamin-dependent protein [Bryobacteraceae bacterium]
MPYLAARVPPGWEVTHVDEEAEEIDWNVAADLVGITFHTPSAVHAYQIAARFRSRGICVVLGGPHVTLVPEEARQHADTIFIGEAEGLWEQFLNSFETRSYAPVYRQTSAPVSRGFPMPVRTCFTGKTTRVAFCLRRADARTNMTSAPWP